MKANAEEFDKTQDDLTRRWAVETGFHDDTTERKVEDLLKETVFAIGISMEKIKINVQPSRSHMHSCSLQTDDRDKYVTSANMLKKELSGRKIRISPAMDAEDIFHKKVWVTSNDAFTQDTLFRSYRSQ